MLHYKPPFTLFNGGKTDKGEQTGITGTQPLALYLFGKFLLYSLNPPNSEMTFCFVWCDSHRILQTAFFQPDLAVSF